MVPPWDGMMRGRGTMRIWKTACWLAELFSLQRSLWVAISLLSIVGLIYTAVPFLNTLTSTFVPQVSLVLLYVDQQVNLGHQFDDTLRSMFWAALTASIAFVIVICPRRKALVSAMCDGYWKNFLAPLLDSTSDWVVVIKPTFGICIDTELYSRQMAARVARDLNVTLDERHIAAARRTGFVALRDGAALPVIFDFGRNLTVLGEIIDAELKSFLGGTLCSADDKFDFIRDKIYARLATHWLARLDPNKRVVIIDAGEIGTLAARLPVLAAGPAPSGAAPGV